jgi:hypothetical protein
MAERPKGKPMKRAGMKPKARPEAAMPHFEVDDPAEAFRRMEALTRHVLSVPKSSIEGKTLKPQSVKRGRKPG